MRMEGDGEVVRCDELEKDEIQWGTDGGNLLAGDPGTRKARTKDNEPEPTDTTAA